MQTDAARHAAAVEAMNRRRAKNAIDALHGVRVLHADGKMDAAGFKDAFSFVLDCRLAMFTRKFARTLSEFEHTMLADFASHCPPSKKIGGAG